MVRAEPDASPVAEARIEPCVSAARNRFHALTPTKPSKAKALATLATEEKDIEGVPAKFAAATMTI